MELIKNTVELINHIIQTKIQKDYDCYFELNDNIKKDYNLGNLIINNCDFSNPMYFTIDIEFITKNNEVVFKRTRPIDLNFEFRDLMLLFKDEKDLEYWFDYNLLINELKEEGVLK